MDFFFLVLAFAAGALAPLQAGMINKNGQGHRRPFLCGPDLLCRRYNGLVDLWAGRPHGICRHPRGR